jgi:hypothetical protein
MHASWQKHHTELSRMGYPVRADTYLNVTAAQFDEGEPVSGCGSPVHSRTLHMQHSLSHPPGPMAFVANTRSNYGQASSKRQAPTEATWAKKRTRPDHLTEKEFDLCMDMRKVWECRSQLKLQRKGRHITYNIMCTVHKTYNIRSRDIYGCSCRGIDP